MTPEKDEELCNQFPLLYRNRKGNSLETLMCFGFCVGDGWYQIIYKLSEQLEPLILAQTGLLFRAKYTILSFFGFKPTITSKQLTSAMQVKEKFGGLRFYLAGTETPEMTKLIREAEDKSFETCENCGQAGQVRTKKGWISTLCDTCGQLDRNAF